MSRRPAAPGGRAGACALLAGLLASGCGHSQLARALAWRDADVDDIGRFPARPVPAGSTVDPWIRGDAAGYDSLTAPILLRGAAGATPLDDFLAARGTTAFLVARGDSLVYERYFGGFRGDSLHTVFSASKSVLSAALGAALDRGLIGGLDDPITRYVPELRERDPGFDSITLRHLVTMTSGLGWNDAKTPWGDPADTYYSTDLRGTALRARIEGPPGRRFVYNNYNPLLVGLAVERAVDTTLSAFLSEAIWAPMGAEADASWSLDRREGGFEKMESGFNARPRDLARFGRLFLRSGRRGERAVLSPAWVDASVRADSISDPSAGYQHFWWVDPGDGGPAAFWAEGRFGQFLYVVPELDLVMVRLGRHEGDVDWRSFMAAMAKRAASDVAAGAAEVPTGRSRPGRPHPSPSVRPEPATRSRSSRPDSSASPRRSGASSESSSSPAPRGPAARPAAPAEAVSVPGPSATPPDGDGTGVSPVPATGRSSSGTTGRRSGPPGFVSTTPASPWGEPADGGADGLVVRLSPSG